MNLQTYLAEYPRLLAAPAICELITRLKDRIAEARDAGRKIMLAGNGACASIGQADHRAKGRRQTVKTLNLIKKPFGEASFSPIRHARYLGWEDAFEVEFEDGLCFLEPHEAIRKANGIAASDRPVVVAVDSELHSHFTVTYESGARVEVSWSSVRENAPAETIPTARVAESPQG